MIALFRLVYPFVVIVLAWLALLARSSASKNAAPQPADPLGRTAADQWFRLLGITPRIAAEADGHEALLTLVALGYGTGIIPRLVLQHSGVRPRLHEVPTPSGPGELVIGVCVRRTDLHRPLVAAAWAATSIGPVPPGGGRSAGGAPWRSPTPRR